jgi:hypothetical protein
MPNCLPITKSPEKDIVSSKYDRMAWRRGPKTSSVRGAPEHHGSLYGTRYKIYFIVMFQRSRDSSVGIATGYGLEGRGSIPGRVKIFSSPQRPDQFWGTPMGTGGEFLR